ncbi:MAG: hypothetical protein CTY30_03340, partial [Methylocystis sp.]
MSFRYVTAASALFAVFLAGCNGGTPLPDPRLNG